MCKTVTIAINEKSRIKYYFKYHFSNTDVVGNEVVYAEIFENQNMTDG